MRWLERQWYKKSLAHLMLYPLSLLFRLLSGSRRILYRIGLLRSTRLPVPVIIVGNITVGGSGKTPLTLWLVQHLIKAGHRPGIISRGYGGSNIEPRAVQSGDNPDETGDEPLMMAQRGLCPVWIGRDRVAAAQGLLAAHPDCTVIISDDGLQHYRLQRDVEIVVVDGVRELGNQWLLPAGPLREPRSRLKSVDAIVVNGRSNALSAQSTPAPNEYAMQLKGNVFTNLCDPALTKLPTDFQGKRVKAIAGIGHPQRFFNHLHSMGLHPLVQSFPDHHRFSPQDLEWHEADAILMTEKDAVKCAAFADAKCWMLRVDAQLSPDLARLILERIAPHGRKTA